jgi:hypothetical protein
VKVVSTHAKFLQFAFKLARVDTQINQGANEHVTADAAEEVEVKSLHALAKALI